MALFPTQIPVATGGEIPTLAPSQVTATEPAALSEAACNSSEFDLAPDLEERMAPIVESDRIRGAIDTLSGDPDEMTVSAGGDTFRLRGIDFAEAEHGRVIEFQGQLDRQDGHLFHAQSYRLIPYAVLVGELRVEELCKMKCDDWLLFDVVQGGQTYTFGLAWDRSKYPELWERAGRKITLAGDVVGGRNWLGLQYFWVRYICE